ncbi:hypothetical protein EV182_005010, partial [Spiromyces aspiralis]
MFVTGSELVEEYMDRMRGLDRRGLPISGRCAWIGVRGSTYLSGENAPGTLETLLRGVVDPGVPTQLLNAC